MKFKLKKSIIAFLVIVNIFSLTVSPAHADLLGVALGNPIALKDLLMESFGADQSQIQNMVKTVNVASKKISPPAVTLTFDPTDPVPGEKVTVTAMPTYFMNAPEKLYFTWYLKSKRCFDRQLDGADYKSKFAEGDFAKCDLNNTGEVDIEDYKIKATRLLVTNDFNWESADYSHDTDNDGYSAVFGGDDQRGKPEHCFVHDIASGDDHEIDCGHLFPNSPGDTTGDGTFSFSEEKFWHTNPNNSDTASTGRTDEANVTGLGENVFTFPYTAGDQVGVAIEGVGIQPTQNEDSSYKTMWAFTKNKCDPTNVSTSHAGYPKSDTATTTQANTPSTGYTTTITTTTNQAIVSGSQVGDNATIRTATTTTTVVSYIDPATKLPDPMIPNTITTTTTSTCSASAIESGTAGCSGLDEFKSISMTDMDSGGLNNCLYQNLVTPTEGGGATEKLDINLAYLPENPINDASDNKNGDTVSFTATSTNASNPDYLSYIWEVFASSEANPDSWGTALTKDKLDGATQTSGLGIDTFKFNLNFSSPQKYLKIKTTVKDTLVESGTREGSADVIIPIFSSEERIKVYTAKITYDPTSSQPEPAISLPDESSLQERCLFTDPKTGTTTPASACNVVKDEVIALEVDDNDNKYSDFLWTIDGKTNICPDNSFSDCLSSDGKATKRTYFPILKEPGDQYSINISALNAKTGEKLSLNKMITISTPTAKIIPKEKDDSGKYICRGLLLGQYLDFDGKAYDDRSDKEYQASSGSNIELYPVLSGIEMPATFKAASDYPYQWTINGTIINASNATDYGYSISLSDYGKLTLPPKEAEETYSISLSAAHTPTNAVKKTLNKYWDVTYNEFYEKKLTDSINIEMVSTEITQKDNSSKKIFATVSSGFPSYFAFLFRIALSGLAIILALKIIFFILPKNQQE